MEEKWKEIKDYPDYKISSLGRVWSDKLKIFMKTHNASKTDLHQKIKLSSKGVEKTFFVHRLVLLAFKPIENPDDFQVNHIDGNPMNNTLENLEWVTEAQNHTHYWKEIVPQKRFEGKDNLGRKPKNIQVEFENGQINYYTGIEEACSHLQINKNTFLRWKKQGAPIKISYVEIVPEGHINIECRIEKKSIPRAVKIIYRDYEQVYKNGREADRALGLKDGTINLWAKRETNKQTPTMREMGILRVEFVKI